MENMGGVMPVYDMARNNTNGDYWGGGGCFWAFFIVLLMCGGFGGWNRGGFGIGSGVNTLNNDFLYTNLNGTIDRGFTQVSNQQFNTQKDIWQTQSALQMQLAQNGFNAKECCCDTNRNIDSVKFENAQNTCAITTNATNNTQKILDKLCQMESNAKDQRITDLTLQLQSAQGQLSNLAQTANIVNQIRSFPQPAYITCSPYQSIFGNNGCNANACGCYN